MSLFFDVTTGYFLFQWQTNYIGTISVNVPVGTESLIDGDVISIKTVGPCRIPLEYGRYLIRVPEYNVECMIHKNNRGSVVIEVVDVNDFDVKCNSNAWLVKD